MALVELSSPEPGVRVITLNRPQRRNALTVDLVTELHAALSVVEEDLACRVVILTGAGPAFCVGLDLYGYGDDEREQQQGPIRGALTRQVEIARLAQRLVRLRQPVIAAVNGAAAGGGLALVLASDIRLAVPSAVFAIGFIKAGFSGCDIGTSWLLPRIVGAGRAQELMLTGRRFDAAEALAMGLLSDVVGADQLLALALRRASEVMSNPPLAVELTKAGVWRALETPSFDACVEFENRQQILTGLTADRTEATEAFLAKRPPRYRDR